MEIKLLEIRDSGTFIPAMAIKLSSRTEAERYLLAKAGYGRFGADHETYVLLAEINGGGGQIHCDAYDWTFARTMPNAHNHIKENWDEIETGDVVDVEFILGMTTEKKVSQAHEPYGGM